MSHSKERAEKICLNCNAELIGRFCQDCGQENIEPKESFGGLITHFFNDITHFDGKFFSTLKYLITRPGFLPKEFLSGRRARYLHPIRMYVFTSAVFFIVFFSLFDARNMDLNGLPSRESSGNVEKQIDGLWKTTLEDADTMEDSSAIDSAFETIMAKNKILKKDSVSTRKAKRARYFGPIDKGETWNKYDSMQLTLEPARRDGWLKRQIIYRDFKLYGKYGENVRALLKDVLDKFLHTFPYLLFVSLPLYALFLKLLYIRRKQFYFADHGIWLIYLYIFTFILLLILFGLEKLEHWTGEGPVTAIQTALVFFGIIYTVRAMKRFYNQGWFKTLTKFALFNILAFISINFLFILFFMISVFRV